MNARTALTIVATCSAAALTASVAVAEFDGVATGCPATGSLPEPVSALPPSPLPPSAQPPSALPASALPVDTSLLVPCWGSTFHVLSC